MRMCAYAFTASSGYRLAIRRVVGIDKREASEFVLIDGAHHIVVDGRQNRIFLGELAVKVQCVATIFLQ